MRRRNARVECGLMLVAILCPSSAFAALPDDFEIHKGPEGRFAIALPQGWWTYDQAQAISGESSAHGMVIFSAQPVVKEGETTADARVLADVDTGEIPSFFVDRLPASKGMSCAKFSRSAAYNLGVRLGQDSIFGAFRRHFTQATALKHDIIEVGGCRGLRYKGQGKKGEWVLDVRAVSDGEVLYLFTLRNRADNYQKNLDTFEKAITTVRLTAPE